MRAPEVEGEDGMARVALVTGGTRGIGRAISARLKADGFQVAAGYSGNDDAARKTGEELGVTVVKGNVGVFEDAQRAVREVEEKLGPVEVLVNNAGITRDGFFHKMTPEQWGEVIRVNMDSLYNMTRQVIEGMRERSFGRIVNISSINGQKGQIGQVNYSAAKAGLIGFTKTVAAEVARRGVTVNAVAPGFIDTEMTKDLPESVIEAVPARRAGTPDEVGAAVRFLASDHAGYVTGTTLFVDGGLSA
jgi:acetoacetyl-CoA reductase